MKGFIENLPEAEYHAFPEISKSGLDLIAKSPAHYQAGWKTTTDAMKMGSAIHTAILEPYQFSSRYFVCDAKDRRQAEYKEMAKEHGAEFVLMRPEFERVKAVANAVFDNPKTAALVENSGQKELSAFATDPETGLSVRCRFDLLGDGIAVDLKKTRDATARGFSRSIAQYRYHVQDAFYSDVYEWITGERLREFWFIAVEDQEPFTACRYRLDDLSREIGRKEYRENLNTYLLCRESNDWPKYQPEHEIISLPEWKLCEFDEELELT